MQQRTFWIAIGKIPGVSKCINKKQKKYILDTALIKAHLVSIDEFDGDDEDEDKETDGNGEIPSGI